MKWKKTVKFNKSEYILWTFVLALGILFLLMRTLIDKTGSTVVISYDGNITHKFSLSEDTTYAIDNYGHNTLVIEDGYAWIKDADCPDKLCINYGKISKTGESIVCLPHKLIIRIEDNTNDKEGLDAIAK